MSLTRILATLLFVVSLGLTYYLYNSFASTIKFQDSIKTTEKQVQESLEVIREAEKVFLEQHGRYTANWDSLINFIENGKVPVTVRTETIIPQSYGVEKVIVKIDTIDQIPAREKIFKKTFTVNANDNGTFLSFSVKVGDLVVKGSKAYKIKVADQPKPRELEFIDRGTINSLADIKPGDNVTKGQNLITFWDYKLNPNVNIKTLNLVPGSNKPFDIFVGKIERSGIKVSVIEVTDPAPINPDRKASNEAVTRQPLHFGSKLDVMTAGNWE